MYSKFKFNGPETAEFQNYRFYEFKGGCIHIECSKVLMDFNFNSCSFEKCMAKNGGSAILFSAASGTIKNCYSYNNQLEENGGFIYYNPPEYGQNEVKFSISNNLFIEIPYYGTVSNTVYSFIYTF